MKERTRKILIGAGALILVTALLITVISLFKEKDESNGDNWEEPLVEFTEMEVTVMDSFTTDRVTGLVTPPLFTTNFLVLDMEFTNPLNETIFFLPNSLEFVTDRDTYGPNLFDEFVGRGLGQSENITPLSSISGYLYFDLFPTEKPLRLVYRDTDYNLTFSVNLSGIDPDYRPWKTPLDIKITGCGREENGSGREQLLYFTLQVNNPTDNSSHFQFWLMDLECFNGVILDGQFLPQPEGDYKFRPGWNVTYKMYFDIPPGSPDIPKTLYQEVEGVYLNVDESLYEGVI